ncbi:MAG: FAD-dependent oxidoreductase [Saprospiraceae bacterium]|nr:FAD-dependent oxidoreductase [Saprospiraceae bacterium]
MEKSADILVIGGGSAGIAAAVAAARSGAHVVLLEKNTYAGGNATAAYVGTICGLYYRNKAREARFVMGGFTKDFALQVQHASNSQPFQFGQGLHFLPYKRSAFMEVADKQLRQNKVNVFYNADVKAIKMDSQSIHSVLALVENKPVNFTTKKVIDTSGNALTAQLGAGMLVEEKNYQAAAQVFGMCGVKTVDNSILNLSIIRTIQKGMATGDFPTEYKRLSAIPGTYENGFLFFKLGIPLQVENTSASKSSLEIFSKEAIQFLERYLQNHCDLFANAQVHMIAPEVGIRTGPRNEGKEVLLKKDVLDAKKRDAGIARGAWPIEFWAPGENPRMEYFEEDDYYDIPAYCLVSATVENLFFAGRHISAEEDAIASARVIGTCLATGFAAGKMAAGKLENQPEKETIRKIREEIANI